MLKNKLVLGFLLVLSMSYYNLSHSADSTAEINSKEKVVIKEPKDKTPQTKNEIQEDQKYAIAYDKCIKEAEVSEATYDKVFNKCMEKNGFPQEEYNTGSDMETKE